MFLLGLPCFLAMLTHFDNFAVVLASYGLGENSRCVGEFGVYCILAFELSRWYNQFFLLLFCQTWWFGGWYSII